MKIFFILFTVFYGMIAKAGNDYWYLGQNRGLVKLHNGSKLFVSTEDVGVAAHLISAGYWELWIEKVVTQLVNPNDVIIEVGANNGYYTILMSSLVGDQGKVYSFEGNPGLAKLVSDSIGFNGLSGRAKLQNSLVSDVSGQKLKFLFDKSYSGGGHIVSDRESINKNHNLIEVESVTLDTAIPEINKVNIIKMDAEGVELKILSGAQNILKSNPDLIIIMEWAFNMLSSHSNVELEMEKYFKLGYKFWQISTESTLIPVLSLKELLRLPHCDIIMSKKNIVLN